VAKVLCCRERGKDPLFGTDNACHGLLDERRATSDEFDERRATSDEVDERRATRLRTCPQF
jgi:hypothetical protein